MAPRLVLNAAGAHGSRQVGAPAAIAVALLFVSVPLGLAALAGVPLLLGALWAAGRTARGADHVAAAANSALTERIVEFARTQQALRAARRVEATRSSAGGRFAEFWQQQRDAANWHVTTAGS
ncbi:MAG: hypothetical protein WBA97_10940 [Actinophytocola sp.]|uniref:hypothetical protein n=1 Tax=Actinophytocola sp. TaxID=1872138 RepID=UPI003C71BEC2